MYRHHSSFILLYKNGKKKDCFDEAPTSNMPQFRLSSLDAKCYQSQLYTKMLLTKEKQKKVDDSHMTFALATVVLCVSFKTYRLNCLACLPVEGSPSRGNHMSNSAIQFCKVFIGTMMRTDRAVVYLRKMSVKQITYRRQRK